MDKLFDLTDRRLITLNIDGEPMAFTFGVVKVAALIFLINMMVMGIGFYKIGNLAVAYKELSGSYVTLEQSYNEAIKVNGETVAQLETLEKVILGLE